MAGRRTVTPGRFLLGATALVVALIALPLMLVWKQVYITSASRRMAAQTDSLAVLTRRASRLSLEVEQLSSTQRIEHIARTELSLEYPGPERIVLVHPEQKKRRGRSEVNNEFLAVLTKSLKEE